ncbi:MAG TPA: alpha/beta hydrolase family protein [Pilimelia sp.]|nr:alpha/beta hydrolase family protein [Pilimelia sp.]
MARLRIDFFSDVLELGTSMTVLLPQRTSARIGATGRAGAAAPEVLYLLHGLSDDDTAWTRYTSLERYADAHGLAVVMPQVHRSFYADEEHGGRFWAFLTTELPELVGTFLRVSTRREDTFVAGLSMGGYGAVKWALREPGRFAAAASLSGALDIARRQGGEADDWNRPLMRRVFGERRLAGSDEDLLHLVASGDPAELPRLYVACGTEDHLYPENMHFRDACAARGIPLTVDFGPGDHEWGYWDAKIRDVLAWLPLPSA